MSHTFIPTGGTFGLDPTQALALKRWTREALGLGEDAVITISELACSDPGCPLVETAVAIFDDRGTRQWKFTRPKVALTQAMLRQTLKTPPESDKG